MKILLENVNTSSTSGPNHFGNKLKKYMEKLEHKFVLSNPDIRLCFIESQYPKNEVPMVQRLDGIYFNKKFDFEKQNSNILKTYENSKGVIFQTEFNKRLTFQYFGYHDNHTVIRNGADLELISTIKPLQNNVLDSYERVWCSASSWRPHKRLNENIKYFLENSSEKDCFVIAGEVNNKISHPRIYYAGNLGISTLMSLYKRADFFVHLAWLDHCPNVVVDARACGCKIICSSSGGTKEIAGKDAIVIAEPEWDLSPTDLYNPPRIERWLETKARQEAYSSIDMVDVAGEYSNFLEKVYENN